MWHFPNDCHSNLAAFFDDEILPGTRLTIRCSYNSPEGWSQSLDGESQNAVRLNTSSSRYVVNDIILYINDVNKSDEGLYRCIYQHDATSRELCVYVYGRFIKIMQSLCIYFVTYKTL